MAAKTTVKLVVNGREITLVGNGRCRDYLKFKEPASVDKTRDGTPWVICNAYVHRQRGSSSV